MASLYVVKEAFDEVVTFLAGKGSTIRHDFGSHHISETKDVDCYVWIPVEAERTGKSSRGAVGEHDIIAELTHKFQVYCYGENHATSWAMASNIVYALDNVIEEAACRRLMGLEWQFPKAEGESLMQEGHLLIVSYEIPYQPLLSVYIPVVRHVRGVVQAPEAPDAPTVLAESAVVTSSLTSDVDVDGSTVVDTVPGPDEDP